MRLATLRFLAATTGLLALAPPALAQAEAPAAPKEIVVEAPRAAAIPAPIPRSPYSGAPVVTTTVRITARYDDLDLTRPADAERLMVRIERVAKATCDQLDKLQPFAPDPACVATTVAKARPAVLAAIAAAGPKP